MAGSREGGAGAALGRSRPGDRRPTPREQGPSCRRRPLRARRLLLPRKSFDGLARQDGQQVGSCCRGGGGGRGTGQRCLLAPEGGEMGNGPLGLVLKAPFCLKEAGVTFIF